MKKSICYLVIAFVSIVMSSCHGVRLFAQIHHTR